MMTRSEREIWAIIGVLIAGVALFWAVGIVVAAIVEAVIAIVLAIALLFLWVMTIVFFGSIAGLAGGMLVVVYVAYHADQGRLSMEDVEYLKRALTAIVGGCVLMLLTYSPVETFFRHSLGAGLI